MSSLSHWEHDIEDLPFPTGEESDTIRRRNEKEFEQVREAITQAMLGFLPNIGDEASFNATLTYVQAIVKRADRYELQKVFYADPHFSLAKNSLNIKRTA